MENNNEPIFTVTFNKQTNNGVLKIYYKSKTIKVSQSELESILVPGTVNIKTVKTKMKVLINIFSRVFPECVFVDGNNAFITNFDLKEAFKKMFYYFLENRKCKRMPSVMVGRDYKCSKFYDCLIMNKGKKPKGCIAVGDKSENHVKNNNNFKEPKIIHLDELKLEDNIFQHYNNIINRLVSLEIKRKQYPLNNNSIHNVTVKKDNKFVIREIDKDEETYILFSQIKDINYEAYKKIVESSTHLLLEVQKIVCPLVILSQYERETKSSGTCSILSKKAKPIRVNARKPYVFVPKISSCCYLQYRFGDYQNCWIYQTYYRKNNEELEIEVENYEQHT